MILIWICLCVYLLRDLIPRRKMPIFLILRNLMKSSTANCCYTTIPQNKNVVRSTKHVLNHLNVFFKPSNVRHQNNTEYKLERALLGSFILINYSSSLILNPTRMGSVIRESFPTLPLTFSRHVLAQLSL